MKNCRRWWGTTRPRITAFMQRFRDLGLIEKSAEHFLGQREKAYRIHGSDGLASAVVQSAHGLQGGSTIQQNHMQLLRPMHSNHQGQFDVRGAAWACDKRDRTAQISSLRLSLSPQKRKQITQP